MANKMKRLLALVLAIAICAGIGLPAFANEPAEASIGPNSINKVAGKLENDMVDVTLSVPGEAVDLSSDIVFIIGNGTESNSDYLVELVHKMLVAVDGTPTKVKIGLVCYGDTTEDETVMGLTEMADVVLGNTVADYRIAMRGNDGSKYTEPMADYLARKEAAWAAWEAENPLLLEDMDYVIAKALEKAEDVEDGINMESALITARDMLAADDTVPAERKHMVLVSTGLTYWFDNDDGFGSTVVGIDTRDAGSYDATGNGNVDRYVHGNLQWIMARNGSTNTQAGYVIPFGWTYDTYWDYIESWVAADGTDYVFTPVDEEGNPVAYGQFMTAEDGYNNSTVYQPVNSSGKKNSNFRYGYVIGKPIDQATASKVYVPYFAGKTNPTGTSTAAQNAAHALNYERAQYESWVIYNQMQTPIGESFETSLRDENGEFITVEGLGYNCYSVVIGQYSSAPTDLWLQSNQIGRGFMDMLAGGKAAVYDSGDTSFFEPIANKILYTCAAGSYVEDYIGYNRPDKGNFEFVQDPATITMVRGGVPYTTTQIETKEGATASYKFSAEGEADFFLDYYYGNGKDTEKFIWTFGDYVSIEKRTSLTYKLELKDKAEEAGTYTVDTNLSATLYPIDSEGNEGKPVVFPVPEVTYTVVNGTDIVIKKVDEAGKPLTGAEFALFDSNGEALGIATVDTNGELTFSNLKVGTYTLVETKTPDGYVGLREDITFEVVYIKDHFEVNVKDRYILHFPATAYEISNHSYYPAIPQNFILLNDDIAEGWEYTGEYVFGESDFEVVYCADSTVGAENQYVYTNKAVEDVFSVEVAEQLRAIISNSYPYVTMEDMIAAATVAGVADAANLTRGDIIAAVQLAIWKCTNDADHTYRATYSVMNYPKWGKVFHDYTDELPDDLPKNTTKTMQDTAGAARVEALYDYLLGLEPLSAEESAINVVCYLSEDGKDASQTLIGATKNNTTITVKNHTQYDMDIVLALGAGIAKYDGVKSAYSHTYDSIVNLVEPLVLQGHNVKLGLVAVEHYDDVAMELTVLTKDNYEDVIQAGLETIQSMPAGPTNLHSNLVAAQEMLEEDKSVPDANKFFYVFATGRTYNYDNAAGVPTTIINKVSVKGSTYYYWGHYLWQSQRGGHTSLYMIPDRYNNNFADYWADVVTWVGNDGDKYAYSFTDAYDVTNPQWFNTFYNANNKDLKALKIASSRFGWALTGLTNSGLDAIGSGSNPQNALNYERAQYEAYQVYADMASKYNCYALCTESPSYLNDSLYITLGAGYKGTSRIQLGHSFMDYLAQVDGQEKSTVLFKYVFDANNNPISTDFTTTNYFDGISIDTTKLAKTEKAPAKGPIMMSPAPKLPVVITNQPQSVVAEIGEKVVISVEAQGEGLTYQWYYRNKGAEEFAMSSYKGKTYSINMAEYCNGREVYCVITNADGFSVTTETVMMSRPARQLQIVKQPESVIAAIGEKVVISVEAEGEGLTYQWYYRNKGGEEIAASSYKGKTYSINMAEYCNGREVYCVITDENGNTVTTEIVMMSRPTRQLQIVKQPEDVAVAIGEKVVISVEAEGDGLTYQWYYRNKNGKTFAASSYKGKTYSVSMAEYCDGREVYCVITDENGNTVRTETVSMSKAEN